MAPILAASDPGATTASGTGSSSVILLLTLAVTLCYLAACAFWLYRACRRCHGTSKLFSPSGRAWRPCPRCQATGRRLRTGRRLYSALTRYGHAHRTQRRRDTDDRSTR